MSKVFGALILLLVTAALILLYRSGTGLLGLNPTPTVQSLVSAPLPPACPDGLENCRLLRQLPATTTRFRLPAYARQPGTCFYITAFDTSGNESVPSNVLCYPLDYVPPGP